MASTLVDADSAISATDEEKLKQLTARLVELGRKLAQANIDLRQEEDLLAAVTRQFNEACRQLALGQNADPTSYQGPISLHSAKISELRTLIEELRRTEQPLTEAHRAVATKVADRRELAEIARLEEDQREKFVAAEQAREALERASDEEFAARSRLENARRARDLREQRRQTGKNGDKS